MSSKYPILDNRPIDNWKVTELKEELKRRKLMTKGLKDDLIKRLDEALRLERENNSQDVITGVALDNQAQDVMEHSEPNEVVTKTVVVAAKVAEKIEDVGDVKVRVDINDSAETSIPETQDNIVVSGNDSSRVDGDHAIPAPDLETKAGAFENVGSERTLVEQGGKFFEVEQENGDSKSLSHGEDSQLGNEGSGLQLDNEGSKPELDNEDSKLQLDIMDSKAQLEIEDPKPQVVNQGLRSPHADVSLDSSTPNNQVSEVSPNLGLQVKSDSISSDSVSINEKPELKDNIITDNVKLELDVKPGMEASSNASVPVGGESHPMDVEEPLEKASIEEKVDVDATNADLIQKNDMVDVGYSEQLNLDRSSGDESMDEDVMETKQIDSKYNSDDVGDKSEKSEMHDVKKENIVNAVGDKSSINEGETHIEVHKTRPAATVEKRKLHDQDVGSSETLKRQRRWNSESVKVPEPQSSILSTTPKNVLQPTLSRRFSRSDSSVSNEDTPKERAVPPSQRPPTSSLRIDNFLRPFTLKAVQELLGKTGTVTSFWMDQIKTHCYVTYGSVEEATETRNAVYNLQWPPNGGKLLAAEFVDAQEVKMKLEVPQSPATPLTPAALAAPSSQPHPSPRLQVSRQQLPPPPSLPPPPPLSNPPPVKERLGHPPPPPLQEKHYPPIVTLDDLFRKTKATPRIYYLPLSEEQVAAKISAREKNVKQ